jgi:hypothetical protein
MLVLACTYLELTDYGERLPERLIPLKFRLLLDRQNHHSEHPFKDFSYCRHGSYSKVFTLIKCRGRGAQAPENEYASF